MVQAAKCSSGKKRIGKLGGAVARCAEICYVSVIRIEKIIQVAASMSDKPIALMLAEKRFEVMDDVKIDPRHHESRSVALARVLSSVAVAAPLLCLPVGRVPQVGRNGWKGDT